MCLGNGGGGGGRHAKRPIFAGSSVIRFSLKHLSKCFTSHNRVCFFRLGMNMIHVMFHLP